MFPRWCIATALAVVTSGVLSGCVDEPTEPILVQAAKGGDAASLATTVARAIAIAMSDRDVQEAVKNAMRESALAQHKIQLQSFLSSIEGKPLLETAAVAAGIAERDLLHIAGKLPPLDFFVPAASDREQWRVGQPLAVSSLFEDDVWTTTAFTQQGDAFTYDGRKRNSVVLFLLMPEERKMKRVHPQPQTRGDAIQDANDGELAIPVEAADVPMATRVGTSSVSQPVSFTFGRSNNLSMSTTGTYIYDFYPFGFDDGLSGQCEVHWEAYFVPAGSGSWTEQKRWPVNGEVSGPCGGSAVIWDLHASHSLSARKMLNNYVGGPDGYPYSKFAIEVWESDSSSGDDPQGWVDFFDYDTYNNYVSAWVYEHNHSPSRYSMRIESRPF